MYAHLSSHGCYIFFLLGDQDYHGGSVRDTVNFSEDKEAKRTMIVGAGQAGTMIVRQVLQNPAIGHETRPVCRR